MNESSLKPIARLITLQALTFLHPGTGHTTGVVDLPVQREVHTGFPMFAASGFKGSLRDKAERQWGKKDDRISTVFGAQAESDNPSAGALTITDARILAFPVRSLQQVFVWVTCPMVLTRLRRDGNMVGLNIPWNDFILKNDAAANVSSEAKFVSPLILEEIAFTIEKQPQVNDIAERIKKLLCANSSFDPKRFVVIPNEDFQYMVTHATQIATRIKLNDQKTTTGGGGNMWVEETLPPETILYALALCHGSRMKGSNSDPREVVKILHEFQSDNYLQLGGNETVGQGWCCLNIYHGR